jgi:ankyrin repeat protein
MPLNAAAVNAREDVAKLLPRHGGTNRILGAIMSIDNFLSRLFHSNISRLALVTKRAPLRVVVICGLLWGVCIPGNIFACKVTHVYTATEITDRADVILLVKVPDEIITKFSPIEMQVLEIVKGDFKTKTVTIFGVTARYYGHNDGAPPYDIVRPGGRGGSCHADDYKPGGQFLLFLKGGDVYWAALAATNEEVSGPNDPWVVWVRERLARNDALYGSPIYDPVKSGDLAKAKALLENDPGLVSRKDIEGRTPLHWAAEKGYKDIAELLLINRAEIDVVSNYGATPLQLAAKEGCKGVVELLLARDAAVDASQNSSLTPLIWATMKGHKDIAALLLAKGADVNARDSAGQTPLHWAAEKGYKDIAELLLAKGAKVNARDTRGFTPLHAVVAGYSGRKDIVELLLATGADVNAKTRNGETPLYWATNKDILELLLAHGADVQNKDIYGSTPLQNLVSSGNKQIVEMLLAKGADVNAKDGFFGGTLLHMALSGINPGVKDLVEFLLAKGVAVNAKDNRGNTPLHRAAQDGRKDIAGLLLSNKADANARNNDGDTPLHLAAIGSLQAEFVDYKGLMELLLANKADIDARNNAGDTPLHQAALYGRKDMAEWLLTKGAEINAKDIWGQTPLRIAVTRDHPGVAELLRRHGGHE